MPLYDALVAVVTFKHGPGWTTWNSVNLHGKMHGPLTGHIEKIAIAMLDNKLVGNCASDNNAGIVFKIYNLFKQLS